MKPLLLLFSFIFVISAKKSVINLRRVNDSENFNSRPRIIGGNAAASGQFPWQVAIYKDTPDGRYFCSGALINARWVLTAAQCVYEATQFTIQMGSNQLSSNDENRVIVTTSTYVIHEGFDPTISLANDIALIKLRMPITFTDYIEPIIVANFGYLYPGRVVKAAGWGQTSDEDSGLANSLNFVEIGIIEQNACKTYFGNQLVDTMICAEGNYNEGICFGDIGGPLITSADVGIELYVHVAIASFISQNGCESLDPTGYTRVDSFYAWIDNATRHN
ncbi:serine protease H132 [Tribolium castaneum]|uniref:Serine protease H132 n=3 Tax=Tribolium castaneum TaxID=7070 RepID=D6X3A5_TRICA|nr:serine protease H132 [Tribolium castaneum]